MAARASHWRRGIVCGCSLQHVTYSDPRAPTQVIIVYPYIIGSVEPKSFFYSKSVKQKLVATSSTHAELRALYDPVTNLIFLKHLMDELDVEILLPILVHEDNQPAIDLVSSTTSRVRKSKHYLMFIQFLREQLNEGLYRLSKVSTDKNISNVLTDDCRDAHSCL